MEKQRYIKMDELTKNMLVFALYDLFQEEKKKEMPLDVTGNLIVKLDRCREKKLFLTDNEHQKAVLALNKHRDARIAEGDYTDCIDRVFYKLLQAKYKRCAVR